MKSLLLRAVARKTNRKVRSKEDSYKGVLAQEGRYFVSGLFLCYLTAPIYRTRYLTAGL